MKLPKIPYKHIALYITLLTMVCVTTGWLMSSGIWLSLIVAVPVIAIIITKLFGTYTTIIRQLDFIFEAVQNNDNSFRFAEDPRISKNTFLNYSLNRIKEVMDDHKEQIRQREKNFELIMECSNVGIIIVKHNGSVLQTNSKATTLFGVERISHIERLNFLSNDLVEVLRSIQPVEQKTVRCQTEAGEMNLMLTCAAITVNNKELRVITINNIINELDSKEAEAWAKITRILTHEIMNSLAPITSISNTLINNKYDSEKIQQGLEAIHSTSNRLMKFVESFRLLSRVPQPHKTPVYLADIVEQTLKIVDTKSIKTVVHLNPLDIMIYADHSQIMQVMINLVKNAVEACISSDIVSKSNAIEIQSYIAETEQVIIEISNTGNTIPHSDVENIFTPFFTTKEDGSGVGLSISRQIIHSHGGSLVLANNKNGNVLFRITLE